MTQTITGRECRFAVYMQPPEPGMPDLHLVKEIIHYDDKTTQSNVKLIKDYQRPFWITKKACRDYKQKKEWTPETNLIKGMSSQSELVNNIARALGDPRFKGNLRMISASPYLYGSDILSTTLIKHAYIDKWPELQTKYSVAVLDTETDMFSDNGEVIMCTITMKSVVHTAVVKHFVDGIANVEARVEQKMNEYLGDYVKDRNIKSTLVLVDNALDAVKSCLDLAHKLRPDFLAIWNVDFDINKILNACETYGMEPAELFSDPSVPQNYRFFEYKQGKKQKITASGKVIPINPAAQWHTVFAPSSFYVIDAMCVYKQVRTGKPEEQSYTLDYILDKNLGIRKLKFKEAEHVSGSAWHMLMQSDYKIEYIIYNRFDCISMEILDEKTNDMSLSLPLFAGPSDFCNFASQPRRKVDELHFTALADGQVIGSTGSTMTDEWAEDIVSGSGWIVALPAALVADNGLKVIEEFPDLTTNIRISVGDLDVSAAYPTNQCVFNVAKETTMKELSTVTGVDDYTMKMQGINLSAGHTNAAEWCTTLLGMPQFFEALEMFNKQRALQ